MPDRTEQLAALLDAHGASLHALVRRLTARRDVADDLLQDLFLRLHRAAWLPGGQRLAAYARSAAIRLALDWHRQIRRQAAGRRSLTEDPLDHRLAPASRVEMAEDRQALLEALTRLSRLSREAIVLRYLEERPIEEVAQHLGRSAHQTRALCAKGLRSLRRHLARPAARPTSAPPGGGTS